MNLFDLKLHLLLELDLSHQTPDLYLEHKTLNPNHDPSLPPYHEHKILDHEG
jgi:hypothetical protein